MQAYYTDIMGLTLAEYGDNGAVYLRSAFDYHTIALYPSQENCLRHFGLQLDGKQSLKEVIAQLKELGINAEFPQMLSQESPSCCNYRSRGKHSATLYIYAAG